MSTKDQVLHWGPFSRIRRNHALEHATLQVLSEQNPKLRMAGYSDTKGFWLVGEIETEKIKAAVDQALTRLRGGEASLAVHPNCGTNLVTTGFLAGALAWLSMLGTGRSSRDRFERLPMVISMVTVAMLIAQPLGPFLQEHITTDAVSGDLQVQRIERSMRGNVPMHRVTTIH